MTTNKVKHFRELIRTLEQKLEVLNSKETNFCSITSSQCHVLVEIGRAKSISLKNLSKIVGLDNSAASRSVDKLVNLKLVTREACDKDRRSIQILLTKEGNDLFFKIESSMDGYFKEIYLSIPENQRFEAIKNLQLLIEAFNINTKKKVLSLSSSKIYFDDVASDWDKMRTEFFSEKIRMEVYKKAQIQEGKYAADIGAGTGYITEGLLIHGLNVLAVDQSQEMLKIMNNKFNEYSSLQLLQGDADSLPIKGNYVDYVFANMFLHHVESPQKSIIEMTRILKTDGILVITDLDQHTFEFLKTEQHDQWLGFNRKQIQNWLEVAGLRNIKVECLDSNCCTTSKENSENAKISIFIASGIK